MAINVFDAIVVGSGISGGWAAKELCERGLKTIMLERGQNVEHYNEKRIHNHLPGKQSPRDFERQLVHLSTQNRPKVIVYTEGNSKIRAASSRPDFNPETEPQDHVCPMVLNSVKTVNLFQGWSPVNH